MTQKQNNSPEVIGTDVVRPENKQGEKHREKTVEPIADQSLNEGLKDLISDYWEDRQSPGFRGYQAKVSEEDNIEKVHEKKKAKPKPAVQKESEIKKAEPKESIISEDKTTGSVEEESVNMQNSVDSNRADEDADMEHQSVQKERRKPKEKRQKKKKSLPLKIAGVLVAVLLIFLVTVAAVFFTLEHKGKKQLMANTVTDEQIAGAKDATLENEGKTVVYNGETYEYNENISTILCIGVDREEYNESDTFGEGGQADSIFMVVLNHETGQTTMLPISRNTMVEIDEFHEDGTYWRQNEIQIALAYTYGDGKEESCKNVARAVSRLMYGMPINGYAAIDLSVIGPLNDAVGGVEVTVLEDLSDDLVAGQTVTLQGEQAVKYVRSRKSEGYDLEVDNNVARMERQQQYVGAFMKTMIEQTKSNPTLPLTLYNTASEGMITDVTASEVTYFASLLVQHGLDNSIVSIPGTAKKGEYTEVYVDNDALYQIILDTFYVKAS